MKRRLLSTFLLLLIMLTLTNGLSHAKAENYALGFTEGYLLTYEYSYVNEELIKELAEIDYIYWSFLNLKQGSRIQWKIQDIQETLDSWIISIQKYVDSELVGNSTTQVYKNPSNLANQTFYQEDLNFNFIPVQVSSYLTEFEAQIPEEDRLYCNANTTSVIFNFTAIGGYNTFIYQFNTKGFLEHLIIYDLGRLIIQFSLINAGYEIAPIFTTWFTITIISLAITGMFYVKGLKKKKTPKHRLNDILRGTRN